MVAETPDLTRLPLGGEGVRLVTLDLGRLGDAGALAARFLTDGEREAYARLGHPGRRSEWLGARVCLKEALRDWGGIRDPRQCEILKGKHGKPCIAFASGFPLADVYDCSLSHKADLACACISRLPGTTVGVDVERPSPRLTELAGAFVHRRDAAMTALSADLRLAVLWALKEACSKALGVGVAIGFNEVVCDEEAEGRHNLRIAGGPCFRGQYLIHRGFVVALCTMKEGACGAAASP